MSVAQCKSVLHNVKMGCAMSRCVAKVPNPVATNYCYADYSVRHLNENENENNEKTKPVQILKRPPLREGPNSHFRGTGGKVQDGASNLS